jgi:hypothetical protein
MPLTPDVKPERLSVVVDPKQIVEGLTDAVPAVGVPAQGGV